MDGPSNVRLDGVRADQIVSISTWDDDDDDDDRADRE